MNGRNLGRLLVGSIVGGTALWLAFRGTEVSVVADALKRAQVKPILAALLLVAATVAVGAQRWRVLVFSRGGGAGRFPRFLAAVVTGQMLNVLLPIRLGEIGRAYWISRTEHQPLSRVLASIVIERLTDVLMLGVSVSILLVQLSLPPWARGSGQLALLTSAMALVFAVGLGKWGSHVLRAIDKPLHVLPARFRLFVIHHGEVALTSLGVLGEWRSGAIVWTLSAILVVLAAATNFVLLYAFDLNLSPMVALLLFVVLQIGGAPVATPGNVGVFHYLTVLVLTAFGVDRTVALAYAIVLHAVAIGPKIIAGAVILGVSRTPMLDRAVWRGSGLDTVQESHT